MNQPTEFQVLITFTIQQIWGGGTPANKELGTLLPSGGLQLQHG